MNNLFKVLTVIALCLSVVAIFRTFDKQENKSSIEQTMAEYDRQKGLSR